MGESAQAPLRVAGIVGSLRQGSLNGRLLSQAGELLPAGAVLEMVEIGNLPHFDQDLEDAPPEAVRRFRARLLAADGLWLATPEYNASVPGVLKNAIDWASRPPRQAPLTNKPAAIMGASPGGFGTLRAQLHLREILGGHVQLLRGPDVLVSAAHEKFDAAGRVTDQALRQLLAAQGQALVELILRQQRRAA